MIENLQHSLHQQHQQQQQQRYYLSITTTATISGSDGCNNDDKDTDVTYEKDVGVESDHEYNEDD